MSTLQVDRVETPRKTRPYGLLAAGVVVLATVLVTGLAALNGDVTYALGGIETAGAGGVSIWDVFIARPIAYRLLMGALDLTGDAPSWIADRVIRAEADLLIVAVAVLLFLGLRRHLDKWPAAGIAFTVGFALIVSPPWHFLEPDWVAALAAVAAVGASLAPRRLWLGALLGGFFVVLVVAVKLATAPIALLALIAVALFSLRRALWVAGAAAVLAVIWYLVTKQFLPWEWLWFKDQAELVDDSPIHHGLRRIDFHWLRYGLGDTTILSPIVATAPAAFAALIQRQSGARLRWLGAAIAVVATGLSLASAYGQGEFFMYHYAVVPVLAAAVWGGAFALVPAARVPLLATTLVLAAASFVLLRQDGDWRHDHVGLVASSYLLAAAIAAVVVWTVTARSVPWSLGAVVLSVALLPPVLIGAPLSFSMYNYKNPVSRPANAQYEALSDRIGPDTPVLYLAFGSINYGIGNPTTCRYPSPQWLQRGTLFARVREFRSYDDNLKCLTEDRTARYLIVQPTWFNLAKAPPEVQGLIDGRFDCSDAARVQAPANLIVCPAR
ncbi:hypothetical protein BJ973_005083 [Actinoplanes tereljensis]|uniref:Uncharacterized protein n=1 Tax=Paractinoplanes tereljensis TaxID=571912 RepID=A0A919TUL5_9ACTN|nr:hypothetical protein [Actinoplanes tereljensis]GIF21470.1 hypothetical protein Ate02nite_42000 [Actinoplanes tereljensis]